MRISGEDLAEFRTLYEKEFGEKLFDAELGEMAGRVADP
jgi:hypothetical protein